MCIPLAVAALAVSAAGVGLSAYGMYKNGQAQKAQAQADAANYEKQAALANFNASEIEKYGKINSDLTLAVGGLNNRMTQAVADANVGIINASTDFNVGMIKATTDFNVSSAEGAAAMLEAQGDMQAQVHRDNAQVLEVQAQDTLEAGKQAETQSRSAYAQVKGTQRARLAANGVALDEGSALRIQTDTDYASDVDADVIRTNAMKTAMGYRINAVGEQTAAAMASFEGKAQGMQKRGEAMSARIDGAVSAAQAQISGGIKALDTKMTASVQILTQTMNDKVEAFNITNQASSDAWAARASAEGYTGAAAQARLSARAINPALMAGTSLLNGAAGLANQWYQYSSSGAFAPKAASGMNATQYRI